MEVGSFTGAGEQLGISQSAISQQVRALEEELGVTLLVRLGRTTRLTPAGEALLTCARQVLDKLDEARRFLAEHARGRAGVVRIGTPEAPCNYLLPEMLVDVQRRFPKIEVRVVSGHTATTLARLGTGALDVALLPLPVEVDRLRVLGVGRDELVAIVPPDHRWATLAYVTARDFERESLLVYDRASQITDRTLGFLLEEGVFPRIGLEIDHLEALKDLVRRRLGVAVVPSWAVGRELAAGLLAAVRLGPTGLERSWGVMHADLQPCPATVRALVALLADALPGLLRRVA